MYCLWDYRSGFCGENDVFRHFGAGMVGAGCVEVFNATNKLCVEIGFVDGGWPAQDLRSVRRPRSEYSDHEPQ